jgi:hypothetical protein
VLHRSVDAPQSIDVPNQHVTRSVGERDGEKEHSTFNAGASVTSVRRSSERVGTARKRVFAHPASADPCGGLSGSTHSGNRPKNESDEMGQRTLAPVKGGAGFAHAQVSLAA